jgi:hypothetical protein
MADNMVVCTPEEAAAVIAQARQDAVREALAGVKTTQKTGYYSTVRFQAKRTGTTPNFVYTVDSKITRVAFGYKDPQALNGAGAGFNDLPNDVQSSLTQTNLSEPGKTRDGETYYIKGVEFYVSADSDAYLAKLIWAQANVRLKMGANTVFPLGRLDFFPQAGGLVGKGESYLAEPPLGAPSSQIAALGNSIEDVDSYFHFNEKSPLIWNSAGNTDSQLTMEFDLPNDIVFAATARAAAPGVSAWTPPDTSEPFSYVDIAVRLVGESINNVSANG